VLADSRREATILRRIQVPYIDRNFEIIRKTLINLA